MSVHAISWVLKQSKARLGDRLVLIVLADHANSNGEDARVGVATIARESMMSQRNVQHCLRNLEASGQIERTGQTSNGIVVWRIVGMSEGSTRDEESSGVQNFHPVKNSAQNTSDFSPGGEKHDSPQAPPSPNTPYPPYIPPLEPSMNRNEPSRARGFSGGSDSGKASRRFVKPKPAEVEAYGKEIGYEVSGAAFCDFYESKGWKVGSSPMKDWKAAVRTWKKRDEEKAKTNGEMSLMDEVREINRKRAERERLQQEQQGASR